MAVLTNGDVDFLQDLGRPGGVEVVQLQDIELDDPVAIPIPVAPEPEPPSLLALVAGVFAADVARVFAGARLAHYFTAPEGRRHVWHCWFASDLAGLERRFRADPGATFRRLTAVKARDLVVAAYGACPAGLLAALAKCGPKARSPEFYRALFATLGRGDLGAKLLRHTAKLTDALVFNVAALPPRLQSKPLFDALRTGSVNDGDFANACWTMARLEALGVPGGVDPLARTGKLLNALTEALATLPFPPPPWAGTGQVRPLASLEAMKRAGTALKNCLGSDDAVDLTVRVVRRRNYFYEWLGDEPGLLQFTEASPLGWYLEEGRGRDNTKLSTATWTAIERALASWPDLAPVWIDGDGDALGRAFFRHKLF